MNYGKKSKYIIPEEFEYVEARKLFLDCEYPDQLKDVTELLKWSKPEDDDLLEFLVKEKNFSEDKVLKGLQKLKQH